MLLYLFLVTQLDWPSIQLQEFYSSSLKRRTHWIAFLQVHDSTVTRSQTGTGLGLAIASRLCNIMGGKLKVESVLGKGSTFTASFKAHQSTNRSTDGVRNTVENLGRNVKWKINLDSRRKPELAFRMHRPRLNLCSHTAGNSEKLLCERSKHPSCWRQRNVSECCSELCNNARSSSDYCEKRRRSVKSYGATACRLFWCSDYRWSNASFGRVRISALWLEVKPYD